MTTSDLAQPLWISVAVASLVCGAALWKGGWPERTFAVTFILGWIATEALKDPTFNHPQWGAFVVTLINLALLIFIALRTNRQWALWASGFQVLNVVTHAAKMADKTVGAWAYATAGMIWSYMLIVALGVGVWQHDRQVRR